MGRGAIISALFWGLSSLSADAWVAHTRVKSCVFTIGSFCPLESIGGTLLGVGILAGLGFGFNWLFRR